MLLHLHAIDQPVILGCHGEGSLKNFIHHHDNQGQQAQTMAGGCAEAWSSAAADASRVQSHALLW
jgi:hypothetical protein